MSDFQAADYRWLGRTGVRVSRLGFGTMSFGGDADEETSQAMFRRCLDAGINLFDTADVYNGGRSEEILGRLAAGMRDDLVIATKAYFPTGKGPNDRGATRRHLVRAVEASLRRLGTDRVDLFFLHRYDDRTPLEETLRAVEQLVRDGKVLYPAVSNFAGWQAARALGIAEKNGWSGLVALQPMYNLVKRQAEAELLPFAAAENISVFPYSPLGGGLLTGKYGRAHKPESGRLVGNAMYKQRYGDAAAFAAAEGLTALAAEWGIAPAALAIAFVRSHPAVTAPLLGARNLEQLDTCLASLDVRLDAERRARVAALYPAPPPATDRIEERAGTQFGTR